jgi:hypothetical protein
MHRLAASLLLFSALLSVGCAARSSGPARPDQTVQEPTQKNARWREMTWNEYYAEVVERARRRGIMVVWISPPRPVTRADRRAPAKP